MHVSFVVYHKKNYNVLCNGPFSHTMHKARKMIGPTLNAM